MLILMHVTAVWTDVANLVVTTVLAVLTGIYVILTRQLLRSQTDPCVIVTTGPGERDSTDIDIVIRNVGRSLARDIRFELSEAIMQHAWAAHPSDDPEDPIIMNSGPLIDGIPAMGPDEELRFHWGRYAGLKRILGDRHVVVTCRFKRGRKEMAPVECVLDIRPFGWTARGQ